MLYAPWRDHTGRRRRARVPAVRAAHSGRNKRKKKWTRWMMASFVNQFTLLGRSLFVPHLLPHPLISKFNRLIHQSDKNKTTTNKQTIKRKKRKTNLRCRNGKPSHPPSTLSRIATTAYSRPYPDAFQLRRTAFLLFSDLPPPPTLSARLVRERKKKRDARGEKKGKETSASNILPFFFFCWACIYCCASLFFFFLFWAAGCRLSPQRSGQQQS